MADSQLYTNAVGALGSLRGDWDRVRARLEAVEGPDALNQSGQAVVEMIRTENHLSADPAQADHALVVDALTELCKPGWPPDPNGVAKTFNERVQGRFKLSGDPVRAEPDTLYRYINGSGIFGKVADALRSGGRHREAAVLEKLLKDAPNGRPSATWQGVVDLVRSAALWGQLPRDSVRLTGAPSMFITFETSSPAPRGSASRMYSALALWKPLNACFVEARYEARDSDVLLFPTFADAGWYRFFVSAAVGAPHGWTRPHDDQEDPQAEAVQEPQSLARLGTANDLRVLPA